MLLRLTTAGNPLAAVWAVGAIILQSMLNPGSSTQEEAAEAFNLSPACLRVIRRRALLVMWDGQRLVRMDPPGTEGLLGVWARSPTEVYVTHRRLSRWDGRGWTVMEVDAPGASLEGVSGSARVGVVTGGFTRGSQFRDGVVEPTGLPFYGTLRSLRVSPSGTVWMVGSGGAIQRSR